MKIHIPWKKLFRISLFLCAFLITLLFLVGAWFSYQGRKELAAALQSLKEKGEPMTFAELLPEPIAPEDNFFADPMWEELADTHAVPNFPAGVAHVPALPGESRQLAILEPKLSPELRSELKDRFPELKDMDPALTNQQILDELIGGANMEPLTPQKAELVLALLEPSAPMLERFRELGMRPKAYFPLRYEDGFSMTMEHVSYVMGAARLLGRRAQAQLTLGQSDQAFEDTQLIFRLQETLASEPLLISILVRTSISAIGLKTTRLGIPNWNPTQLLELQNQIERLQFTKSIETAVRGERIGFNLFLDQFREQPAGSLKLIQGVSDGDTPTSSWPVQALSSLYASTFIHGDQAYYNQLMQNWIDDLNSKMPVIDPADCKALEAQLLQDSSSLIGSVSHHLTTIAFPALTSAVSRITYVQNEAYQAILALAIQREFLHENRLTDRIDTLVPTYLSSIPIDPITGTPQQYRKLDESRYLLWSVGWNTTDENGVPAEGPWDRLKNDWVWSGSVIP